MIKHNIKSLPKAKDMESNFGIKLDARHLLQEWKENAQTKKGYIGCKSKSVTAGLREFKKLYEVGEFYFECQDQTEFYQDDSIEIYYRKK